MKSQGWTLYFWAFPAWPRAKNKAWSWPLGSATFLCGDKARRGSGPTLLVNWPGAGGAGGTEQSEDGPQRLTRASLEAPWWRGHLPVQGTRGFDPWPGETRLWSSSTRVPQLLSPCSSARELQLPSLHAAHAACSSGAHAPRQEEPP